MSSPSEAVVAPEKTATPRAAGAPASTPVARRPVARKGAVNVKVEDKGNDKALIVAGVLILSLAAYVGYRTQVRGESLAQVFSFFGEKPKADAGPEVEGAPESKGSFTSAPQAGNPEDANTLFGRRTSGR